MTMPTRQQIFISDHPESKIRFLETVLGDQDWMTTIVIPTAQTDHPQAYAHKLEETFHAKGYATSQTLEEDGSVNLFVHHLGTHSNAMEAVRELGLVKGAGFTASNIGYGLSDLVKNTFKQINHCVREPGRLLGAVYLAADLSYMTAGMATQKISTEFKSTTFMGRMGERVARIKKPENFLSGASGAFGMAQSVILMKYANTGGETNHQLLQEQFNNGMKAGVDSTNVRGWTAPGMHKPLLGEFDDMLRKNPIDASAWAQIAGQAALVGASAIQANHHFKGARQHLKGSASIGHEMWSSLTSKDKVGGVADTREVLGAGINVIRAAVSTMGWMMMMHSATRDTVTATWAHPLEKLKQEIQAHPERAAGAMTGAASAIGLGASIVKGNRNTWWAESIWLIGDIVMMFAPRDKYSELAARRELPLIDATTQFMLELPVAISEPMRAQMIEDLAAHLANKTVYAKNPVERLQSGSMAEEAAVLKQAIVAGVSANLNMQNTVFTRLAMGCAVLLERFPASQREQVLNSLAGGLANAPGIYTTHKDLVDAILERVDMKAEYALPPPSMMSLGRDISELLTAAPPIANAAVAVAVYDAIRPFIRTTANDNELMQKAQHEAAAVELAPRGTALAH